MSHVARIIKEIRSLAGDAKEFDAILDNVSGINRDQSWDLWDPKTQARILEVNLVEEALESYLNSLDLQTLNRIAAVMYSGRDDGSAVELRS